MQIRPARHDDLPAIVALMNAVDVAALGEPDTTESDIAAGWAEASFDVERDAVVATERDAIVGYAEVYDRNGDRRDLEIDVYVMPALGADVAERLLQHAWRRVAAVAVAGARASTWLPVGDPRTEAFAAAGFRTGRRFVRMRHEGPPPAPAPPTPGVEVRQVLPGLDEQIVHTLLVESFAEHARPVTPVYQQFEQRHVHHPDYDPELWALAWASDDPAGGAGGFRPPEPVGAIVAFDHGDIGFIRSVGVLGGWRRRGIGAALIRHVLTLFDARGQQRVDLGVDVDDPVGALRLYEALGFRVVQQLQLLERMV